MSDLNKVKELIARGEKEQTVGLLASLLLKNTDDLEAWELLAELIDDPARKRACYKQVLRLSPGNLLALKKLYELDGGSPEPVPAADSTKAPPATHGSADETKKRLRAVPYQEPYQPPFKSSTEGQEVVLFAIAGIGALLMILFILLSPGDPSAPGESSANNDALWAVLISFAVIAVIFIIFSTSNKHRG
jgi:hypothetical protein